MLRVAMIERPGMVDEQMLHQSAGRCPERRALFFGGIGRRSGRPSSWTRAVGCQVCSEGSPRILAAAIRAVPDRKCPPARPPLSGRPGEGPLELPDRLVSGGRHGPTPGFAKPLESFYHRDFPNRPPPLPFHYEEALPTRSWRRYRNERRIDRKPEVRRPRAVGSGNRPQIS